MKDQLIKAWQINHEKNLLLIDELTDEALQKTVSTRGGRTIYLQLVHVHNLRAGWAEIAAKEFAKDCAQLNKEAAANKASLRKAFEQNGKAIEKLIDKSWEEGGKVKSFKNGLIPFISYLIAHDAHHRGHALLTLKQCGVKLPNSLKWGLCEWTK